MEEITLSRNAIKALLSDTKMQIMNALKERKKTVSELSEELKLSKSTLHKHLQDLTLTGLILRNEDERKWVYYELSRKGKKVIEPSDNRRVVVLIGLTLFALAVIGLLILQFIQLLELGHMPLVEEKGKPEQGIEIISTPQSFGAERITVPQEDINKSDKNYND